PAVLQEGAHTATPHGVWVQRGRAPRRLGRRRKMQQHIRHRQADVQPARRKMGRKPKFRIRNKKSDKSAAMAEREYFSEDGEMSAAESGSRRSSWVVLTFGGDRQYGGNEGYEDRTSEYYSYDSFVANHKRVSVGDVAIVCDRKFVVGAALIDRIERTAGIKT